MNLICENCNKEFNMKPSHVARSKNHFCCTKCHDEYRHKQYIQKLSNQVGMDLGEWLRIEYLQKLNSIRKIAKNLFGNKNSSTILKLLSEYNIPTRQGSDAIKTQWIDADERKMKQSVALKQRLTSELREKIKIACRRSDVRRKNSDSKKGDKNPMYKKIGEQHPKWNFNRTHEQRVKERKLFADRNWRNAVFERDKYQCQCCDNKRGGNLVAHHIESYDTHPNVRYDVLNGITLCEKCHKTFHGKFGYGNNTKIQFDEFMSDTYVK